MMDNTDLRIKAKKISALDNYDINEKNPEKSFIIIGYKDGEDKGNYKIPLSVLFEYANNQGGGINESELKDKINELIANNEILFPILNGPQGPQGYQGADGSGVDIDLNEIQNQINYLQSLINKYHKDYTIEYNLSHISADSTNDTIISYNGSTILKFIPYNGYRMPDFIEVSGASYSYDPSNKLIRLYNPLSTDNKITITIIGEIAYYTINISINNVTIESVSPNKPTYQIGDTVEMHILADNGYLLPNNIELENASLINYNSNTGILTFRVNGTGNVNISGQSQSSKLYYFGFAADGVDGDSILGYSNGIPNGQITVSNKFYSNSSCPINYSLSYQFTDDPTEIYGDDNVWLIVPTKYFNKNSKLFIDDDGNSYKLTGGNSGFAIALDEIIDGYIDNEEYAICLIANEGISDYINFYKV